MKTYLPAQAQGGTATLDAPIPDETASNSEVQAEVGPAEVGAAVAGDRLAAIDRCLAEYHGVRDGLLFAHLGGHQARALVVARGGDLTAQALAEDRAVLGTMSEDEGGALLAQVDQEMEELDAAWLLLDAYKGVADGRYQLRILAATPGIAALVAGPAVIAPSVERLFLLEHQAYLAREQIRQGLQDAGEATIQAIVQEGGAMLLEELAMASLLAGIPEFAALFAYAGVKLGNAIDDALGSEDNSDPEKVVSIANTMQGSLDILQSGTKTFARWDEVLPPDFLKWAGRVINVLDGQIEAAESLLRAREGVVRLMEVGRQMEAARGDYEAALTQIGPVMELLASGVADAVVARTREVAGAEGRVAEAEADVGHWF